jgi:hypothetical protein
LDCGWVGLGSSKCTGGVRRFFFWRPLAVCSLLFMAHASNANHIYDAIHGGDINTTDSQCAGANGEPSPSLFTAWEDINVYYGTDDS